MPSLQPVRGTQDLLPDAARRHRQVSATARATAALYGFDEIVTPIFEFTEVFARPIGEHTDIVAKEMYSLKDRGGEDLSLRPENTAGVVRAVLSNGLTQSTPLKFFYSGPMFRYERPQKGRFRQFHQIGVELLGVAQAQADIEVIALGRRILEALGVSERAMLELNTLGDPESRADYRKALGRLFLLSPLRSVGRQPAATRHQPAAHPRFERPRRHPHQFGRAVVRPLPQRGLARFLRRGARWARPAWHRVPPQCAAGARARLLHAHGLRVRHHRSGRSGDGVGRRAL